MEVLRKEEEKKRLAAEKAEKKRGKEKRRGEERRGEERREKNHNHDGDVDYESTKKRKMMKIMRPQRKDLEDQKNDRDKDIEVTKYDSINGEIP